jgi:hypothetical protein
MKNSFFNQLINEYKSEDLYKKTKLQLIYEVVWLRYCFSLYLTKMYAPKARGGRLRGKIDETDKTKYQEYREFVAQIILAKHMRNEKISHKILLLDLAPKPEISSYIIRDVLTEWNKFKKENSLPASKKLDAS